jgi:diguanylate cyclase (GGDEF)-like protein
MDEVVLSGIITGSALVGLGVALVFLYLQRQARERYFRTQESLLAVSKLEVDATRVLDPQDIAPSLGKFLETTLSLLGAEQGMLCVADRWKTVLPSVERGLSPEVLELLHCQAEGDPMGQYVRQMGGVASFRELAPEKLPEMPYEQAMALCGILGEQGIERLTVAALVTPEHDFGLMAVANRNLGRTPTRLLQTLATQISLTLENYVLIHEAQRRTKEYELLTQIGQVVSSRLDPDGVLQAIHKELGQLFDTDTFYVAFLDDDEVRFELEVERGEVLPKRTRPATNGVTEHIVRSGRPVLVQANMEEFREQLGVRATGTPAKCFCGVPVVMSGRPVGVMAALHYEREYVYGPRDLEVMQTAAGQLAVAMENAVLFAEEQRRARYLAFLNNVSKTAISSQNAEQMMDEIVSEISKNFNFEHIGIGILDYATKDIEIKAEAGTTSNALGRRVPLGVGILGRVARTDEMALVQNTGGGHLLGIIPESRSVLCVPVTYGESLMGVLNVESTRENAFQPQEVLILRTLADLVATALHNAFVFQKMQQQSITDALTGIKTRRFFLEALGAEWKRASRSGRPFSVVLIDLDKFKEVNDSLGHLEGDLVLARVGRLLEQKCRQSNVVARYGGDEFVILMPETGVEQAQILSERLRLWIATDPMLNERHITGSFGVAAFPLHGASVEDIVRVADAGMYVSKHAGGNRVATAEEFVEGEGAVSQRQLVTAYVEGFLQREHLGPDCADDLVATLRKLANAIKDGSSAQALMEAIRALTRSAETREVHASGHGETVAKFAQAIGKELGLPPEELNDLVFAAQVHNVGKILMPERLLNKAGALSQDEYYLIKMHAELGARIVETIPGGAHLAQLVRHHHERFDGHGYPEGLEGEQIPLGARIIAVGEAYVNMTADRPYANVKPANEAMAELESLSGTQFDGMLVRILIRQLKGEKAAKI